MMMLYKLCENIRRELWVNMEEMTVQCKQIQFDSDVNMLIEKILIYSNRTGHSSDVAHVKGHCC